METSAAADESKKTSKSESNPFPNVLAGVGLAPKQVTSESGSGEKSEVEDTLKQDSTRSCGSTSMGIAKADKKSEKDNDTSRLNHFERLASSSNVEHPPAPLPGPTKKGRTASRKGSTRSATPTSLCGNDTESTLSNISDVGTGMAAPEAHPFGELGGSKGSTPKTETAANRESSLFADSQSVNHSVIVSSANPLPTESSGTVLQSGLAESEQRIVSPLKTNTPSAGAFGHGGFSFSKELFAMAGQERAELAPVPAPAPAPAKKPRRGRTPKATIAPDSPPSSPEASAVAAGNGNKPVKRRKKAIKSELQSSGLAAPNANNDHPAFQMEGLLSSYSNHHDTLPSITGLIDRTMQRDVPTSFHQMVAHNVNLPHEFPLQKAHTAVPTSASGNAGMKDNITQSRKLDSPGTSSAKEQHPHHFTQLAQHQSSLRNGMSAHVPHMLGNHLNPASSVAQKMSEFLSAEQEAHSVGVNASPTASTSSSGVPFPRRNFSSPTMKTMSGPGPTSAPQNLEQLLERQWEQGSQCLMEQAQHFDSEFLLLQF